MKIFSIQTLSTTLLTILILFTSDLSLAKLNTPFEIVCDHDVARLSQQFAEPDHWSHSFMGGWATWAHDMMGNKLFVGGIHANELPDNKNPELQFVRVKVTKDEDGPQVNCIYAIGNAAMLDVDKELYMSCHLYSANDCYKKSNDTVVCDE